MATMKNLTPAERIEAMLEQGEKVHPDYRQQVEVASLSYCDQLSEKDGSRKMLGRFIGMDRAERIFREVIR